MKTTCIVLVFLFEIEVNVENCGGKPSNCQKFGLKKFDVAIVYCQRQWSIFRITSTERTYLEILFSFWNWNVCTDSLISIKMSVDAKQLLKVAKQALTNKHHKIAIEKCEVIEMQHLCLLSCSHSCFSIKEILQEDPKNYTALLVMAAAYQDTNVPLAVKYLRMATECGSKDPTHAYQGLLKHAPNNEIPAIAAKLLQYAP